MSIEIREARAEEMEEFHRVGAYAFANNEFNPADETLAAMQPEWTTCAFVDGRMAATAAAYPFLMRFNGARASAAGVTAVGTLPEFRRRGLLRQIIERDFVEYRERGQCVAILWASMSAIYQRFGYGLASTWVRYEFDPRYVAFESGPAPSGSVGLMEKDEARPILERLYVEYSRPRNLMLHRAPRLWDARLRVPEKRRLYIAVHRDVEGEPRGYITYETKWMEDSDEPGPNQLLTIRDFVALDAGAYRGLWEYIRSHDLVRTVRMFPPEDDLAPSLLLEPRMLRRLTADGIWLRVVDVEQALAARVYGDRGRTALRIAEDPMCPWNEGTFLLETDGERSEITRVDRDPDLTMSPRALASLISGHDSASHLARAGMLEGRDEQALLEADRLFATRYRPYCADEF